MTVSVLTIARCRETHLHNVILGLSRQTRLPDEFVIGVMADAPYADLPPAPFPIRQVLVPGEPIPLAKARNAVARAAKGEALIFVDVDCIPAPELVEDYAGHLDHFDGVLMGEVLYLPKGAAQPGWRYETFAAIGVKHSDRQGPPAYGLKGCEDYRCFWSLNFALKAETFSRSGGFDETYSGYGGEDTDFGRTLDERAIPIAWCNGGRVYHQYHPHHMPPVHHVHSIVANSERFCAKWGHHTMGHWLRCFRLMGLVTSDENGFRVIREPGEPEFARTRQQAHQPYASSYHVLKALEAEAGLAPSTKDKIAVGFDEDAADPLVQENTPPMAVIAAE
ncbi:MAG: galactosyltransferase-related protein [Pseudomonadota bacterium]